MPFYYYDSTMLLLIPAILLTLFAQMKIQKEYSRYSQVRSSRGTTGFQTAQELLRRNGITDVRVERSQRGGTLSDHYDPRNKVVRLSDSVYGGTSLASNVIAAHEVGHAIQHAKGYAPLVFRDTMFPIVNFASQAAMPIIFAGLFFSQFSRLLDIGIFLFSLTVLFQLITLPVEFNASRRAMAELSKEQILVGPELQQGRKVLTAAALTYVAAAASALMQLLRLMLIRNRRNDRE